MNNTMFLTTEAPEAMSWGLNTTNHGTFKEIKMDSNFLMLLASLVFAVSWVVYIAYYNSRVFGYIITKIVNRLFISEGYFKIGSFSFNALSGKIMFRDVVYITYDYTARVQDGYLIFRWWRSYIPKDVSEDLSHSDTRLSIMLIGFELHVYNRCDVYSKLEEIFGLKEVLAEHKVSEHLNVSESLGENSSVRKQRPEAAMARTWRDLIPVIKCDISSSRIVFGNRLIPTTLSISFEESHFVYSTKPAVCTLDKFMHFVKCKGENVKVMLAPSLKYTGLTDQPPRYMGEGFVLLQSNNMELYFYMDEPGLVPEEPVLVTLPNGDVVASSAPKWGIDIKCGKSTNFSYGPWADRQREHLFKFFYPQDYLPMEVTKTPKPGDKRQMESFDIRMLVQNDATIDVLFTKDKETNAVHINIGAGSYLEVTIPWVTKPNGYTNKINGQLLHVEATTSLQFRDFIKSETFEFGLECHYPLVWNEHQLWKINLTACKATIHVIFSHKWFFQDMINDWASKQRPDLIHFVPYTWRIALNLKHCELLTLVNQYNWIDCSSVGQRSRLENTMFGCCAHFLHLSFDLPFDEYLPETIPLNFGIQGESIDLSLFIPEFHSSRNTVTALHKHSKLLSKDGSTTKKTELIPKWRNVCKENDGWIDFWWVPIGAINIMYTFHPQPPLGPQPQADISTPVKEEILLSPMRFPHNRKNRKRPPEGFQKFDPTTLKADTVNVELEIGPSVLRLYGTALKNFMNFKENIFGEDQSFTDMQQTNNQDQGGELKPDDSNYNIPLELREDFDKRDFRPLEVDVSIVIHDIQAHLLKHCTEKDPPCPVILVERFGFEMKKRYEQTELQLLLSPAVLLVSDNVNRSQKHRHLNQGKITLSSIQVRGHAMFSDVGRSLDQDTLEYAWLVEVHMGKLTGKLTTPQLCTLAASIETLVVLSLDDENELIHPTEDDFTSVPEQRKKSVISTQPLQQAFQQFYTNVMVKNQQNSSSAGSQNMKFGSTDRNSKNNLKLAAEKKKSEDLEKKGSLTKKEIGDGDSGVNQDCHKLKYKFTRVAVDALDIWLVESGTALQLWVSPLRLSTCNLHGKQVNSGLSCIAFSTSLRQLIWQQQKYNHKSSDDLWLEVGAINFGPIIVESAISSADVKDQNAYEMQQKFLRMHDDRQKKLWFLWPELNKLQGRCGCTGGCYFFGENRNGPRFFRPTRTDLEDGINVSAFRINEPGSYPGFGQSILHEGMLIFRTTPYIYNEICLQDVVKQNVKVDNTGSLKKSFDSPRMPRLERERSVDIEKVDSPITSLERKASRRFSSSSVRSAIIKEVPYARLVETCPPLLTTAKLDSDSKLHMEKGKLSVTSGDVDLPPKNSISDSKLAVDYFNSPKQDTFDIQHNSGPGSDVSASSPGANISLNESESQQSIGTRHSSEERLQKEVQRTTSMSSENHSEAFFSADEDLHLNSRSSSLRNSILSTGGILMRQERQPILASTQGARKKFSSELSIVTDRSAIQKNGVVLQAPGSAPETTRTRLSTHRSDHEIHTPEHRSFTLNRQSESIHRSSAVQGLATPYRNPSNRSVSPRLWPQTSLTSQPDSDIHHPELDTRSSSSGSHSTESLSNNSFVSAQGSQEDFTLIDLHRQVNRPIVDSSMLMSSYVTHLSQLRCTNWNDSAHEGPIDQFSLSLFERIDNKLVYSGGRFVPQMETVMDGMTSMKMVTRCDSSAGVKTPTSPFVYSWEQDELDKELEEVQEEEILGFPTTGGCRTTIIVKLKGDLDVMVSPLLLESLQRFVDSLTSTVAGLHPLTVINHLHTSCVSQVASANVLQTTANVRKICQTTNGLNESSDSTNLGSYEETIKTQLQAAIFLPKVNVTFLQVSIVEEIISFSALDNVKDLTCVSLLSVCFDNIVMKLHCDKQAKEVLQKFHRPAVVQTGSKKGANRARILLGLQTYTNADIIKGEPVFIESCKKLQKQLVICLNIGKVHAQLRRLKNESSILDDAVITAIPSYKSKVLFTPAKMRPLYRGVEYYLQPSHCEGMSTQQEDNNNEDKIGFIMFECGLEGINLKIVKKSQFEEESEEDKKTKKIKTGSTIGDNERGHEDSDPSGEGMAPRSCSATPKNGDRMNSLQRPTTPKVSNEKGDKRNKDKERNTGTNQSEPVDGCKDGTEKDMGNVSSCVIELKVVWFNFAAPPRAPITRKIDYTRLDWNLLSTASPAINAWMNPSNRLAIRVVHLVRTMYRRSTATVACIMAEALDIQRVHTLPKSRYGKLTPLSQTLQNDPNLQLCSILERYYLEIGANVIESNLKESEMPQLFTLRQGIVVLSRQWKNILYTPLLGQHTTKSRVKPLNITIAIPEVTEDATLTDGEASANEEHEITDENARLLRNFKTGTDISTQKDHIGLTTSPRSSGYLDGTGPNPQIAVVPRGVESMLMSPSPPVPHRKRKKSLPHVPPPNSSRASVVLPLLNNGYPFVQKRSQPDDSIGYGALREDRTIINMGSDPSEVNSGSSPEMPSSPLHRTLGNTNLSEDMYSWMAKQDTTTNPGKAPLEGCLESKINTLQTESSGEADTLPRENSAAPEVSLAPIQDSGRLLDANQIFQPILSVLGVIPQQLRFTTVSESCNEVTTLDALGSNFCLVGSMDTMRIDIVVSEADYGKSEKKKGRNKNKQKLFIDIPVDESPSFVCEKISVEIEIERIADMNVNEMMKSENIFYISRSQLKNHTSTVINFTVGVHYISQRVNMPLLRLLHQISNMYQNVKDARNEMHEQQPTEIRRPKTSASDHLDMKLHSSTLALHEHHVDLSKQLSIKVSDAGSYTSSQMHKAAISPSPSLRSRPQSFAQKLISTSKSVKGYINLNEGVGTPITMSSPSGSAMDRATVSSDKSMTNAGRCWKTIYHLIDLYSNMPETKTINHRFSMGNCGDISEHYKGNRKYDLLTEMKSSEEIDKEMTPPLNINKDSTTTHEHSKLVVFGVARIHRTKLLATLSGLKLEAEITSLHSSLTCRNKTSPNVLEYSITGQVGKTMIVLLEGTAPNLQTVVKVTIGKSQTLYSSVSKRSKDKNAGLLTIGAVNIDIPQHPVALHGMVTRGSKQLSSTIQELRVTRTASRMSRGQQADEEGPNSPNHPLHTSHIYSSSYMKSNMAEKSLLQPLVMQFSVILQSLSITAALLPSLQAQYKMDQVNSTGFTGSKAKFTIELPHHSLSFNTKLQGEKAEANLPSEASISLPAIHVSAEYIPENAVLGPRNDQKEQEGAVFKPGGYLNAKADIGIFKHSLTTDLLNHLVFVQKVFMKEINEVIQKVYGGERPVPLWLEEPEEPSSLSRILFSLIIRIQGIEITATTAGSSAVRLETGEVVFELSNRIQNISRASRNSTAAKLFGKAQVDLKLSLGQLIRNAIFEEAEIEFQPVAFFNTRIGLRNAFQDEIVEGEDKEVVLLTLKRPLVYVQPAAIDKAILVWLNYKNAYDYWNEKRANLNREMLFTTNQAPEKFQLGQLTSQLSTQHLGTLFMQLTVEDMGICLPLNPLPVNWNQRNFHEDIRGAVVVTLENTSISACSSGCLVSKGKFSNLCLRFADDFENSFDDWKPDMNDTSIMNLCVVSDGTYDFCSRTIATKQPNENAKWFLSVQWQMEGVDIHLDTNIGKQLSALGHTLTMLTGAEDPPLHLDYDSDDNDTPDGLKASQESILKAIGATTDHRARSKAIEKAMNEQAKIINDLRSLGASHGTIEDEMKKLHELEELVYKDFRRDMIQKLRRQSVRASSIKRKFGLGDKGDNSFRSKSFVSQPMPERDDSPDNGQGMSGSYESSPTSGPSRSSSLRVKNLDNGLRVHFNEQPPTRKSSLPSACSDLSITGSQIDWVDQLDIDGEKVQLRKKLSHENHSFDPTNPYSSSNFTNNSGVAQKPQEPNVDLELDVKVFINSGKCVLHTKDIQTVQEDAKLTKMKKDRSCSAGLLEFPPNSSSPDPLRRNKDKNTGQFGTSRLRMNPYASLVDLTIFHIPGMDVKLHYVSKVVPEAEDQHPDLQTQNSDLEKAFNNTRSFSATFTDESEELRIEKAFKRQDSQPASFPPQHREFSTPLELRTSTSLHGITNPNYGSSPTCSSSSSSEDVRCGATPPISPVGGARANLNLGAGCGQAPTKKMGVKKAQLFAWMTLQSVPEETIISPHILEFLEQTLEPIPAKSTFRTDGDTSWMSSDQDNTNYGNYVYASFPVDVIVYFHMQPSTFRFSCLPVSRVECLLKLPSLDIVFSSKRAEDELLQSEFGDGLPNSVSTAVGGLSVTACLSDFSVYIFHPYGGKKTTLKESQWSPLSDSERKDSLSINVEFVKIHLSRSRMLNFQQQDMSYKGKSSGDQGQSRAVIRFSTITDIGSASFKYDMRRLTEILAFPKAWYRRSIVRRMFLGDLSMSATHTDDGESSSYNSSPGAFRSHENRGSKSTDKSPLLANRERLRLGKLKEFGIGLSSDSNPENHSPSEHKNMTSWETLVLFAVNFKKLNVHMNMGNVMGNVSWLTKEFRSDGRLGIGSTGHKNLYIALGLGGSGLDAKGGIVGGNIEIANIDTFIHIREEPDVEPDHTVGVKLHALELRLDYMATSVLMFRVSDLKVNLRDEWKLNKAASRDSFIPTRRPAMIFMHGDLGWDQLQMMISKNTTTDLLKMFNKLEEFFSQQFNSSKRAFSGYSSSRHSKNNSQKAKDQTSQQNPAYQIEANHHRHWQRVLATIAGLQLNTMPTPLPQYGTVLGGTMELHGNNISLACFHGVNFKSKSWALFSLKEPCITFNTEAQEIPSTSEHAPAQDVHIVQTLTCSLGLSTYKTDLSMATVCKVSRTVMFPPQFKTWQEWFHYTFASSQIDEVDRFPSLERERNEATNSIERNRGNQQKLPDPNLNREVIFAVPSLQLHLKTEHLQTSSVPDVSDEKKPSVECSFITEFEDHIFVTVDAEAFFFLHDVITSYIREKERVLGVGDKRNSLDFQDVKQKAPTSGPSDPNRKGSIDSNIFSTDWRDFTCKTWHLEPTVRLLSVAGKYIEPYGVDYILQKLGFSHARVTIPKWMQRGFMDPLDATLAVLTLKMIQVVRGEGNKNEKEKAIEAKK